MRSLIRFDAGALDEVDPEAAVVAAAGVPTAAAAGVVDPPSAPCWDRVKKIPAPAAAVMTTPDTNHRKVRPPRFGGATGLTVSTGTAGARKSTRLNSSH